MIEVPAEWKPTVFHEIKFMGKIALSVVATAYDIKREYHLGIVLQWFDCRT